MTITSIKKSGSNLEIYVNEKNQPIVVNCVDFTITSYTGRKVKNFPSAIKVTEITNGNFKAIVSAIKTALKDRDYDFRRYEKYINELDYIANIEYVPNECPKGYIKWAKENQREITTATLYEFKEYQDMITWTVKQREVYSILKTAPELTPELWYHSYSPIEKNTFNKIFKNSTKNIAWTLMTDMIDFLKIIADNNKKMKLNNKLTWEKIVNTNRDFRYNYKLLEIFWLKSEMNEAIISFESNFTAIEKLSNSMLSVILPKSLIDLLNEGEQQNNCVGTFYNSRIVAHQQIIYFIRKTENTKKSYITCRYSIKDRKTVEDRIVNNGMNNDKSSKQLISEVDTLITQVLETL